MLSLCIAIASIQDYTCNTTSNYRKLLYHGFLNQEYDTESVESLTKLGFFMPEWIKWMEEDCSNPKITYHTTVEILCRVRHVTNNPSDIFFKCATSSLVVSTGDIANDRALGQASLFFFAIYGDERHASVVASVLTKNFKSFYGIHDSALDVLHHIGTVDEIKTIDVAKDNGLRATDGDFWKKAAEAKKAILARAEAKKNAELKAKAVDK